MLDLINPRVNSGVLRLTQALATPDVGNLRETAFLTAVSEYHAVGAGKHGDFRIGDIEFEVGGANKKSTQLLQAAKAFRVLDDRDLAEGNALPLWLFGTLTGPAFRTELPALTH